MRCVMSRDGCARLAVGFLVVGSIALMLQACGSDDDDDIAPPPSIPERSFSSLMSSYPESWGVIYKQSAPLPPEVRLEPTKTVLSRGTIYPPSALPLPCDIEWERDVPVDLRDGVVIHTDVFRAAGSTEKLPSIVSWSPYGKQVPQTSLTGGNAPSYWQSGLQKFEGADPAYWACNGYAVVQPDGRGVGKSQGNIPYWGSVDAGDGYDVIEWIATQDWSNGKVGLHGTSWLAIAQWYIAAARPPHLAAMAPWNGFSDVYRDHVAIGGIPSIGFITGVSSGLFGENSTEYPGDYVVSRNNGLMNDYWDDKAAKLEEILVPAYVVSDMNTTLHRTGALDGFRRMGSTEKWLRTNDTNEWYDQYSPWYVDDLRKFFDYYLKGIDNGWPQTPKVRMAVLDGGGTNKQDVPYSAWPMAETMYQKYYLSGADNSLSEMPLTTPSAATHSAVGGSTTFTYTFTQDVQMAGYIMARIHVEAAGSDDMDINVALSKTDSLGTILYDLSPLAGYNAVGSRTTEGRLRASMRELDPVLSTDFRPNYTFRNPQKLSPGEIVPLDIMIMPWSQTWHPGQKLQLVISARGGGNVNAGTHVIHTGGQHESYLQIPLVPVSK